MNFDLYHNTFLTNRFFLVGGVAAALFGAAFLAPPLFYAALALLAVLAMLALGEALILYSSRGKLSCVRDLPLHLSLGDEIALNYRLRSSFRSALDLVLIDEWPVEYQRRSHPLYARIPAGKEILLTEKLRPVQRGQFAFGRTNVLVRTLLGLVEYRHSFSNGHTFSVYPSVIQMKQHELAAIRQVFQFQGQKKMRKLGHSYEFEQIRNYVTGDDYRSVNWKATGRKGELMVNQYGDERSQQIYSVIDTSRVMQLPFNGMTLLDYAVNTALVISNIALLKHDKAGVLSFAEKMGGYIKASARPNQLRSIMELLYRERPSQLEANYFLLYSACQKIVRQRSLLILYTNFESVHALDRVLPLFRKINRLHLLLVVFFKNAEMAEFASRPAEDLIDVYDTTMAGKFLLDKKMMVKRLQQYGIQSILTTPEELSIHTVNKYTELKARGLI